MEHDSYQGGAFYESDRALCWPRYIGALALDAWLMRIAVFETLAEPASVELVIAQYRDEDTGARELSGNGPFQLPLHLQWGMEAIPDDLYPQVLTPEDAAVTRRLLATAVAILAG